MNPQKSQQGRQNFLQRRYAVSLGRRYVLATAGVVLMGLLGCSSPSDINSAVAEGTPPLQEAPKPKQINNAVDNQVVAAHTKFGLKLFSEVLKQDSGKNVFVSPSSVAIALSMTYNGANGSTQAAMAKALEFQGMNLQQINAGNAALKALLEHPDPKVQLTIANSLWANNKTQFNPDFLQRNREFYSAMVRNLDFSDRQAPRVINNWVSQNTKGKIDQIVDSISPNQVLFLINAIYFKGAWKNEFDKQQTANQPFTLASGKQKNHPMMSQSGNYKYLETPDFQAVSLPYGEDGRMSFYVFLPKQNSNLSAFYNNLNFDNWEKWMTQFRKREGFIRLPKFKMDYEVTLNKSLKALGMAEAFTDQADFSGMGTNLAISQVKHKTFVEVNEEGTEAAAATSVAIRVTSAPIEAPFQMIVERPFFCAIRDNQTGTVLFMGSIVEPR
ncbi:MAG: serpin family protein [Nostocaceae cyanobacterium]|nr:serpin family protein [Nostocaceae cyanobacterium]